MDADPRARLRPRPERRYRSAKALRKALAALALRVRLRTRVWPVLRLALLADAPGDDLPARQEKMRENSARLGCLPFCTSGGYHRLPAPAPAPFPSRP